MENNNENLGNTNWTPPPTNTGGGGGELPNAKSAYTLGLVGMILSFICCCYINVIGLVLGIIGFMKSKEAISAYEANPGAYNEAMYKKAKLAKTFSTVAIIIGILLLVFNIASMVFRPFGNMYDLEEMMRKFK